MSVKLRSKPINDPKQSVRFGEMFCHVALCGL